MFKPSGYIKGLKKFTNSLDFSGCNTGLIYLDWDPKFGLMAAGSGSWSFSFNVFVTRRQCPMFSLLNLWTQMRGSRKFLSWRFHHIIVAGASVWDSVLVKLVGWKKLVLDSLLFNCHDLGLRVFRSALYLGWLIIHLV